MCCSWWNRWSCTKIAGDFCSTMYGTARPCHSLLATAQSIENVQVSLLVADHSKLQTCTQIYWFVSWRIYIMAILIAAISTLRRWWMSVIVTDTLRSGALLDKMAAVCWKNFHDFTGIDSETVDVFNICAGEFQQLHRDLSCFKLLLTLISTEGFHHDRF